jgi:hypothetical protein
MTVRKTGRLERRELVERLLREDHERSDRAISRLANTSHTTVARVRAALVASGQIAARRDRGGVAHQAGHGNLRRQPAGEPGPALQHGAFSETTLPALRTRFLEELRAQFPDADETLLGVQAGRLARYRVLTDFFDRTGFGGLIQSDGKPREVTLLISRLEDSIERCHGRLSGDGANGGGADPYAAYQRIVEQRGGGSGDGE